MNTEKIVSKYNLNAKDIEQLGKSDIDLARVEEQVNQLKSGTEYLKLLRACRVDDGIVKVDEKETQDLTDFYNKRSKEKEIIKFVPASGAASRMFKKLESFMSSGADKTLDEMKADEDFRYIFEFFNNLSKFAFYDDLKAIIEKDGNEIDVLVTENKLQQVLEYLLTKKGLSYSTLPKALVKFHVYRYENHTPLEEQIKESIKYLEDKNGNVKLHFTIAPEYKNEIKAEKSKLINKYNNESNLEISFSYQKKSTDTVALDKNNNLFREEDEILLRPGGHGALIENLNELDSDIIFVKNIDNVQRAENLDTTITFKKVLGAIAFKLQDKIHNYLKVLDTDPSNQLLREIINFIKRDLGYKEFSSTQTEVSHKEISDFLNRPIRVCGVVINEGHPGGGPFWIKSPDSRISKQIVESGQVDKSIAEQKEVFNSSTHFNPVDIVCLVKDYKGNKFDLVNYVDHSAVLVANKSHKGKELKALELPGLWNGAMANWITFFVEVPKETFTPVKEVNDLLQDYHQ